MTLVKREAPPSSVNTAHAPFTPLHLRRHAACRPAQGALPPPHSMSTFFLLCSAEWNGDGHFPAATCFSLPLTTHRHSSNIHTAERGVARLNLCISCHSIKKPFLLEPTFLLVLVGISAISLLPNSRTSCCCCYTFDCCCRRWLTSGRRYKDRGTFCRQSEYVQLKELSFHEINDVIN